MKLAINLPLLFIGSVVLGMGLADGGNWMLFPVCIFTCWRLDPWEAALRWFIVSDMTCPWSLLRRA